MPGSSAWKPPLRPKPRSVETRKNPWNQLYKNPALVAKIPRRSQDHRLLDRHRALLPADELHRLRTTAPAAGGGSVHPPRFPAYFRVELSWAKLIGVAVILAPVPARLKEWANAGFAINLVSALIAHLSMGDGPDALGPAAITGVLWGLSYFFWRRLEATPASE